MEKTGARCLMFGALVNFAIALLHLAIMLIGPPAYLYFGRADLARLAAQGSPWAAATTTLLALAFALFGVFCLSAAGRLRSLPLLRTWVFIIGGLYTLRGLILVLDLIQLAGGAGYPPRQSVFSAASLLIGIVILSGAYLRRRALQPVKKGFAHG